MKDLKAQLQAHFPEEDLEWRFLQSGVKNDKPWATVVAYVTNRDIMDRLDEVFGLFGWSNDFREGPQGGVLCGITIFNDASDDEINWLTKWDGAENSKTDPIKGGLSDSMKRAAVHLGIGRYLYGAEIGFAQFHDKGRYKSKIDGKYYSWDAPKLVFKKNKTAEVAPLAVVPKSDNEFKYTADELIAKIEECDQITHLKNWWKKHQVDIDLLSDKEKQEVEMAKDAKKVTLTMGGERVK